MLLKDLSYKLTVLNLEKKQIDYFLFEQNHYRSSESKTLFFIMSDPTIVLPPTDIDDIFHYKLSSKRSIDDHCRLRIFRRSERTVWIPTLARLPNNSVVADIKMPAQSRHRKDYTEATVDFMI